MKNATESTPFTRAAPAVHVTVVSGISGSGKTTLVDNLVQRFPGAVKLHFDDYADLANDPAAIHGWLERGADPHEIETPALVEALTRLRAGATIELPQGGRSTRPCAWVVIEDPFGRSRADTAPLIDLAVHLETPGDVALARRVVRSIRTSTHDSGALLEHLERDLSGFLVIGREAYAAAGRAARDAADLVLDGMCAVEHLVDQLEAAIDRHRTVRTEP